MNKRNKQIGIIGKIAGILVLGLSAPQQTSAALPLPPEVVIGAILGVYDRPHWYDDRPYYYYGGRYYYGGVWRNGYYYYNGRRYYGGGIITEEVIMNIINT